MLRNALRIRSVIWTLLLTTFLVAESMGQAVQLTVADTTAKRGDTLSVPIRISSLTGLDVFSGQLTLSYNSGQLLIVGVETAGTVLDGIGNVLFNQTTRQLAFAHTTALSGSGNLIKLKVIGFSSPSTLADSIKITSAALNEGTPAVTIKNGYFRFLSISLSPKSPPSTLVVGDLLQYSVSGDQQLPLTWSTSDPSAATIDGTGKLTALAVGQVKVFLEDARGLRDSSNLFAISPATLRSLTMTIRDTTYTQTLSFNLPIYITDVTTLGIISSQFTLTYNGSKLQALDVITAGSKAATWSSPAFSITSGRIDIALAGSTELSGEGVLVYVRFRVAQSATGTSSLTLSNVVFNETINANLVGGTFTALAAPVVIISPNSAIVTRGESWQFNVTSGGTPPYTWFSSNPSVASINSSTGLLTALTRGTTTVTVVDNLGFTSTTGSIVVNDIRASMPDTSVAVADSMEVPIYLEDVTGLGILAFEFRIKYSSGVVRFRDIVNFGTMSSGFTVTFKDTLDTLRVAAAGSAPLIGGGHLVKLRFKAVDTASVGNSSSLDFTSFKFNEPGPATPTATFVNGRISIGSAPPAAPTATAATSITSAGFTANWNAVSGATSYRLDVAIDNGFTSPVTGFSDLDVGTVTTEAVTGLAANSTYYYRVRAMNEGGTSPSSNTIMVTTQQGVPVAPTATVATSITSTGFTANWDVVGAATSYKLDVSTDAEFGSFVLGYQDLPVDTAAHDVTGLAPITAYYYRVRAVNAEGTSPSSNTVGLTTLVAPPTAPTALAATNVDFSGFVANWEAVNGATSYGLDVSTNEDFTLFVVGYIDLLVTGTSSAVTGLASNTTYYYRVRAGNEGGTSPNSNTIAVTTLVAPPTITSSTPSSGPIGTTVIITGTNFNTTASNNIVYFGAVQATVTSATATSLTVTVPTGASYAPITVTVNSLTAYSQAPFIVTFPGGGSITASSFASKVDFTTETNPFSVAIGDLDGDGKPDMVVTSFSSNLVSVFRNTSTSDSITFASKVDFTTGTGPYSVIIGDLDGDGKPDLAVANFDNNTVSVFRNTSSPGSLTFSSKVDFATGTNPFNIAVGDLDGDGKPEVVVTNYLANTLSVFRNTSTNGTISLSSKLDFTTAGLPRGIGISDIDGDGKPDVVVASEGGANVVSVFRNSSSTSAVSLATRVDFASQITPHAVAVGEIDGDGKLDIVVTNESSNSISVLRNMSDVGSVSFAVRVDFTAGSAPRGLALGDVEGDGKPDIALVNYGAGSGATVSIFRDSSSSGDISLAQKVDFTTGTGPNSVAISDVDGDGKPDLVVANFNGNSVSVFRNKIGEAPAAPTATAATNITSTGFTANWTSVSDATEYRLDVSPDGFLTFVTGYENFAVTDTSHVVTGLAPNTLYSYQVRALNEGGVSENSNTVTVTTLPAPPAAPTANEATSITSTGFTADWTSVSGAAEYRLDVSTDNFVTFVTGYDDLPVNGIFQSVTGLTPNTTYSFRVRAVNAGGASPNSNTITVTTIVAAPATPTATAGTNVTSTGFTANWDAVADATEYRLDVSADNFSTFVTGFGNLLVNDLSQNVSGLTPNTEHFYRVRAGNAAGTSPNSNVISVTTLLNPSPAPELISPADQATGVSISPTLEWNASAGAETYRVQVATSEGFDIATIITDQPGITGTTFELFALSNNTTYFWRVSASNAGGEGPFSATRSFTTIITTPDQPFLVSPENGAINVSISPTLVWNALGGATAYHLQVSKTFLFTTTEFDDSTLTDTTRQVGPLGNDTTYFWRVSARNEGGVSAFSEVWSFTTIVKAPSAPTLLAPADRDSTVSTMPTLSWNASAGAETYRLQLASDTSFTLPVFDDSTLVDTTMQVGPLGNDSTYFWRVNAKNAGGTSPFSPVQSFRTTLEVSFAPTLFAPLDQDSTVSLTPTLMWYASEGAATYRLQVATDTSFSLPIFNDSTLVDTTKQVGPLGNDSTYYWRVSAKNSGGVSPFSEVWSFRTMPKAPLAPELVDPLDQDTTVSITPTLTWKASAGAWTYWLQVAIDTAFTLLVFDDSTLVDTTMQIGPLDNDSTYYWRVAAKNVGGISPYSAVRSFRTEPLPAVLPLPPELDTPGENAVDVVPGPNGSITFTWFASEGASSYTLEVSTDNFFGTLFASQTGIVTTSATVTGFEVATTYFWRVSATNSAGTSPFSAVRQFSTITTVPDVPTLVSPEHNATGVSTDPTLVWNSSARATSYGLQVSLDEAFVSLVADQAGFPDTSFTLTGLLADTVYYWRVNAANDAGTSVFSEIRSFRTSSPALALFSVSPSEAARGETLDVVLKGANFIVGVSEVDFGSGITINSTTVESTTSITANITINFDAATGPRDVSVTNASVGGGTATLVGAFTVGNPFPSITSINPQDALRGETVDVTVDGSNFIAGTTSVSFGSDITVNSTTVAHPTSLTANITVPLSTPAGSRDVTVTSSAPGGGAATLTNGFTVLNPVPTISAVAPSSGSRGSVMNVTISGTSFFEDATSVSFGTGVTVNSLTVSSQTQLLADISIDAGTTSGVRDVSVTNSSPGGGTATLPAALTITTDPPTGVEEIFSPLPKEFALYDNYPNPFNPTTVIRFALPERSAVRLSLHSIIGNLVRELLREEKPAGTYEFRLNAGDLPSGVYLMTLYAEPASSGGAKPFRMTKKMLLLK